MAVNYYRYDDTDAPSITGTQGSLITVLDACLVNGYSTGGTEKVGAGWTKEYSATSRAAYRKGGAGNPYFVIDDDGTENESSFPGENATIRGYMVMTGLDTGRENQFPTVASQAKSTIKKAISVDAISRNWVLIEDNGFVHLFIDIYSNVTAGGRIGHYCFGEFISNIPSDNYNFLVACGDADDTNYNYTDWAGAQPQIKLARSYNQVDESRPCVSAFAQILGNTLANGLNGFSEADNSISLYDYKIFENNSTSNKSFIRGKIPGLFYPFEHRLTQAVAPVFDTFTSQDTTINYIQGKATSTGSPTYAPVIQTNGTWT